MSAADRSNEQVVELTALGGALAFLASLAFPAYGAVHWLRYGEWNSISVDRAVGLFGWEIAPSSQWAGVNKIIGWYAETNIGWSVFVLGIVLIGLANLIEAGSRPISRS